MKGDVTRALTLNGERLGEMPISADNSRLFGLFRFRDETASRIKNVPLPRRVAEDAPAGQRAIPRLT